MAPNPALLTDLGREMLQDLPPVLREDPDIQATIHCYAKESERVATTLERVRANLIPSTADELGLPWWEAMLKLTVNPPGQTVEQRRTNVIAMLLRARRTPAGSDWVANVTELVGPGWSYTEHIPGDPAPPEGTLRIVLPFPPESDRYRLTERLIRDITPAHLDIEVVFEGGFILDQSEMDQETFHPE